MWPCSAGPACDNESIHASQPRQHTDGPLNSASQMERFCSGYSPVETYSLSVSTPFYPQIKIKGVQNKIKGLQIKMSPYFNFMSRDFNLKSSYFNLNSFYFNLRVKRCSSSRRSIQPTNSQLWRISLAKSGDWKLCWCWASQAIWLTLAWTDRWDYLYA